MTKPASWNGTGIIAKAILAAVTVAGPACQLPPRETWAKIQSQGLIPVLMAPRPGSPDSAPGTMVAGTAAAPSRENPAPSPPSPPVKGESPAPYAAVVAGRPGFVYSPFTGSPRQIDVRAFHADQALRCPYSMKSFRVPGAALANVTPESPEPGPAARPPSPAETPRRKIIARTEPARGETGSLFPPEARTETTEPKIDAMPIPVPEAPRLPEPAAASPVPYGTRVAGRPGFVHSPYAQRHQLVDVTGIAPGVEVKCPYTDKAFRVPAGAAETGDVFGSPAPSASPPPPAPAPPGAAAPLQESPAVKEIVPEGQ